MRTLLHSLTLHTALIVGVFRVSTSHVLSPFFSAQYCYPLLLCPGPGGDTRGHRAHHPLHSRAAGATSLELQTKVHEDFTITEKAPTRGFYI